MTFKPHDRELESLEARYPAETLIFSSASVPIHIPTAELEVIDYWREIDAFKTSQKLSEGRKEYSFFDGPPFATGKPHYGHLLAGTIKVS